ncbi:MAG TPA: AAA family ATPase [Pyrinomonadaceae bacterium]|nr:AAA family ATPase [Pyrinomonadaceae bacterium]
MYIQKAEIKNIRSIVDFEIEFKNPAGWHVLIGDNGAGKTTIVRSMALALAGNESQGLRANWEEWLKKKSDAGQIWVDLNVDKSIDIYEFYVLDKPSHKYKKDKSIDFKVLNRRLAFSRGESEVNVEEKTYLDNNLSLDEKRDSYGSFGSDYRFKFSGYFSVAYGPYRRFEGGSSEWDELFKNKNFARLAAHLSVFGEDIALTEVTSWLKDLNYKSLEKNEESEYALENLKKLINYEDEDGSFLPHNTSFETVNSDGVFFKDGNGTIISVNQMSDGYRSILSMTFELIRQLVRVYSSELVFKNIEKGEMFIDLPGVVLVDEIDAHLHPTWQTRIGQWFLKYFPKLQFIVTTHSPLVCRAAENGSIWRLAAPGSDEKSGEITGLDRERLIYGNVLDAYGTEVFGTNVAISEESVKKQEILAKLSKKKMLDDISPDEEAKLDNLKKVFTTDAPIEL